MPQFDPLFQQWETNFRALVEHLGALHSSPSYKALESSAAFFAGESQAAIRDLQAKMNHLMADFSEFSTWIEKLRSLRARNPGVVSAFISGRGAWELEVEELLSGPCIQMPIKGAVSILEPNLPRVSVSAQQLYEELWREAKLTEKAIQLLEDSQIKLNQEVASIETAIARFRADASGPFLDQFKADLELLDSLGKSLPEKVLTWGRDPLSSSVWSELKSLQQQVKQSADHLAEERAAAAIIHDLLQEARPKLAGAKTRAQALAETLQTAPFDPQLEMRPPAPESADLLQAWLEKLQDSAAAGYPAKRVVQALRTWNARLEEFDSAVNESRKKLQALEQDYSECRGLYQALLVKSERKGLPVKEKAVALSAKLEAAFAAKAVNLAEVKRLIKSFVEVLC